MASLDGELGRVLSPQLTVGPSHEQDGSGCHSGRQQAQPSWSGEPRPGEPWDVQHVQDDRREAAEYCGDKRRGGWAQPSASLRLFSAVASPVTYPDDEEDGVDCYEEEAEECVFVHPGGT